MFLKLIYLEWKQFFRSSYWQRSLAMNLFLGFLALYMLLNFFAIGIGAFYLLKERFPDKDPLFLVNSILGYWFLGDLIIRYWAQKLPTASVYPLLILPVRKKLIARYILFKSGFSFWFFLPLTAFVPFAVVLWINGYNHLQVSAWLATVVGITLANNYLNYLINRSKKSFFVLIVILITGLLLDYTGVLSLSNISLSFFNSLKLMPWLTFIPFVAAYIFYWFDFQNILHKLYLDSFDANKTRAQSGDIMWVNKLGETGIFLNNEIKKIWRSKRTKNLKQFIIAPLFGIFYMQIIGQEKTPEDMQITFIFVAIYMLGIFSISYANYIPSWDSAYYPFIMSQKINFKKYLEAKWILLILANIIIFILSIPYIYYGWSYLGILFAVLLFNIGFINPVFLWLGSYNTQRIDLNAKANFNTQGLTVRNFITAMFILMIPMIITVILSKKQGLAYGMIFLILSGLPGILFKNYFLTRIENKYLQKKYKTLHGFKQKT